ncbi:MAG: LysR family transcriptional regulator [Oscillospiraceae bacterium]|nr:LysR family transcriptional regulator [Oscillospiraceae bacterium]
MELQQLKYFKAVADIGKISEAAERLFVSAPALSTSISRMEKELGVRLFDRTNNRITLNTQGQIFLKYTNQIFSCLENANQELRQSLLQQGPHISIVSVNNAMWVNLITAFLSEYPQYTLSSSSMSLPQLAQHGLHSQHSFLLAYDSDVPDFLADELDSIFLFQTYPAVAIHKDHPLAGESELDIRMLANEKVFLPLPGYPLYMRLEKLFALYDLPFPVDNVYSLVIRLKMVSENKGITFLSDSATQVIPSPNIRYIPLATPFAPWKARMYWRKDRPLTAHETTLKDFCQHFYESLHQVYVMLP